ncbi:TIGR00366 family protein [Maricurvus nonylphenolicus]|uniref:short-chain fatty acid transporter n=1 Tax=Maricurvus nonylphenolicus TaxID=1008307 RepID=UPI0036F41AE8
MKIAQQLIKPFTVFITRYYPDAFVFAILITVLTFILSITLTDATATTALMSWGDGLPALLKFAAQLSLTLLAAHALAHTDVVHGLLERLGNIPKSASAAYALVAFTAGVGSLIAWSLGLIVGVTLARHVAIHCANRGIKIHYPLLVASAYAGFVIWHMGYSSSAALFVATPGHSLEAVMGVMPITETVFSLENGIIALIALLAITIVCPLMHPDKKDIIEIRSELLKQESTLEPQQRNETVAQKLENMRALSIAMGLALAAYMTASFAEKGFFLTLDIVNWSFVSAGLLLARSPLHYMKLIQNAGATIGPIIIQYPFYAGALGIMSGTGLVTVISDWFTSFSTAETLGLNAFLSAGLINMFIPSGGGQWAIQGPIFIEAAQALGVDHSIIVMAVAYGDQWSNMIQPFWTIPLLAIAGLHLRQVMGYTVMIFLVTGIIFATSLLILSSG